MEKKDSLPDMKNRWELMANLFTVEFHSWNYWICYWVLYASRILADGLRPTPRTKDNSSRGGVCTVFIQTIRYIW
jgi:hypothetical protein